MKNNFDGRAALEKIIKIFSRYQVLLFFITVSTLVIVATFLILQIFNDAPEMQTQNAAELINKDHKETVKKLSELRSSDSLQDLPVPAGRFSPFFESEWNTDIMK